MPDHGVRPGSAACPPEEDSQETEAQGQEKGGGEGEGKAEGKAANALRCPRTGERLFSYSGEGNAGFCIDFPFIFFL